MWSVVFLPTRTFGAPHTVTDCGIVSVPHSYCRKKPMYAPGVSQTALQKSFRKAFGTSVGKYILSTKMCAARRLLGEEGLSVKEVAARTGFATPNYFCQTYRAFYGHPPSSDLGR